MSFEERFFQRVKYSIRCWEWQAGNINGYGVISERGVRHMAHRWSYQYFIGQIPDGYEICHHCDNPSCINPFHLFAGTRSDNMKDASSKGRLSKRQHWNALKTHCPHGHPYTDDNVILKPRGRYCRICTIAYDRIRRPRKTSRRSKSRIDLTKALKKAREILE